MFLCIVQFSSTQMPALRLQPYLAIPQCCCEAHGTRDDDLQPVWQSHGLTTEPTLPQTAWTRTFFYILGLNGRMARDLIPVYHTPIALGT